MTESSALHFSERKFVDLCCSSFLKKTQKQTTESPFPDPNTQEEKRAGSMGVGGASCYFSSLTLQEMHVFMEAGTDRSNQLLSLLIPLSMTLRNVETAAVKPD